MIFATMYDMAQITRVEVTIIHNRRTYQVGYSPSSKAQGTYLISITHTTEKDRGNVQCWNSNPTLDTMVKLVAEHESAILNPKKRFVPKVWLRGRKP